MIVQQAGSYKNVTASGTISVAQAGVMLGFYVNSTSSGTVVFREGSPTGTAMGGTITPAIGWHAFPAAYTSGLYATVAPTLDLTIFFTPG